jgi:hypothetical protein
MLKMLLMTRDKRLQIPFLISDWEIIGAEEMPTAIDSAAMQITLHVSMEHALVCRHSLEVLL